MIHPTARRPPLFIVNNCSNAQSTSTALFGRTISLCCYWSLKDAATADWRKVFLPPPFRYSWSGATLIPVVFSSLSNKETLSCCINHLCVNALSDAQLKALALFIRRRTQFEVKVEFATQGKL